MFIAYVGALMVYKNIVHALVDYRYVYLFQIM